MVGVSGACSDVGIDDDLNMSRSRLWFVECTDEGRVSSSIAPRGRVVPNTLHNWICLNWYKNVQIHAAEGEESKVELV